MKTVIYLIAIIGWGILQARRKAMREQQKKQATQARAEATPQTKQRQSIPLGPVSAEENRPIYQSQQSQVLSQQADYAPTQSNSQMDEPPKEIQPLLDFAKRRKAQKQERPQQPTDEQVEEIVQPVAMEPDAYDQVATVRRSISFDPDSLRTFVVTREVLGPPRAKRPHRSGVRER